MKKVAEISSDGLRLTIFPLDEVRNNGQTETVRPLLRSQLHKYFFISLNHK